MVRVARLLARLLVLALLVTGVAACGDDPDDAARVGDEHLSREEFQAEVDALLANEGFRQQLVEQGVEPSTEGPAPNFVATWLTRQIYQLAVDAEFEARDLEVTDALIDEARRGLHDLFGGAEVFDGLPSALRDTLVERSARTLALGKYVEPDPEPPTENAIRAYYDTHDDECASGRGVSHILVGSRADAEEILQELEDGAVFSELAGDRSNDPGSAGDGGDLGCFQQGVFVAPFEKAVEGAALDVPVGPVETDFGFHVILVRTYVRPTYEEARDDIAEILDRNTREGVGRLRQSEVDKLLRPRLTADEVSVDARYGTWVVDGDGARVEPPHDAPGVTTTTAPPDDHDEG